MGSGRRGGGWGNATRRCRRDVLLCIGSERVVARRIRQKSLEERRRVGRLPQKVGIKHAKVEKGARVVWIGSKKALEQCARLLQASWVQRVRLPAQSGGEPT